MKISIALFILLISGCTHTLYYGETTTQLSNGEQGKVQVHWSSTDPLIGQVKTDSTITMNVACSANLSFIDSDDGISYLANPNVDVTENGQPITDQSRVCGQISEQDDIDNILPGPVTVTMFCRPTVDDFAVVERAYPVINNEHVIDIQQEKSFSLLGESSSLEPLACEADG